MKNPRETLKEITKIHRKMHELYPFTKTRSSAGMSASKCICSKGRWNPNCPVHPPQSSK